MTGENRRHQRGAFVGRVHSRDGFPLLGRGHRRFATPTRSEIVVHDPLRPPSEMFPLRRLGRRETRRWAGCFRVHFGDDGGPRHGRTRAGKRDCAPSSIDPTPISDLLNCTSTVCRFPCRFQAPQWASPTPANLKRHLRDAPAAFDMHAAYSTLKLVVSNHRGHT